MAANTTPVFTLTPNIGAVKIGTTSAQVKSDGTSAGTGTDLMYSAWASGANGSIAYFARITPVASAAAVNTIATVIRLYRSTVNTAVGSAAGATTSANTFLIGEIPVGIVSASNATTAAPYTDFELNVPIGATNWIYASQHTAQTTNQNWQVQIFGGDY